jgi:predicted HTH transcriptional regulator
MLALPADFSELVTLDPSSGAVVSREGKRLEFNQDSAAADFSDYTKALAAFANSSGEAIVFGVSKKPRMTVGAKDVADETDWANRLRDEFDLENPVRFP